MCASVEDDAVAAGWGWGVARCVGEFISCFLFTPTLVGLLYPTQVW